MAYILHYKHYEVCVMFLLMMINLHVLDRMAQPPWRFENEPDPSDVRRDYRRD